MKYSFLKKREDKVLEISVTDKGVDLTDESLLNGKSGIKKGKNIWFKNGRLETRPGFKSDVGDIIKTQMEGSVGRHNFHTTNVMFNHMGSRKRLIYETFYYDMTGYAVCVYLLGSDGGLTNLGCLYFSRLDDSAFYVPENITFYVGKPQNGGGIFALVSLYNEANPSETEQRIYEIDSSLNDWNVVTGYYVPTVYINGRGNDYETAVKTANANLKGSPTELETLNLLNGSFYAYYSSDSYSYSFRLPYSNLADESVICRIYVEPEKYTEWVITKGRTTDIKTFLGYEVMANVDRTKGIVYFTVPAGTFNIPTMVLYAENNIRILATVNLPDTKAEVISSTCSANIGSRTIFSGGKAKNKVFYTKYDNPLYFPRNIDDYIGFSDTEVKSLVLFGEKVYAFKQNGIYSINLKKGKSLNSTELVSDNDNIFFKNDSFEIKCVDEKIGCAGFKSVGTYNGILYLLGTDRRVYSMNESGKLCNISAKIQPFLNNLPYGDYISGSVACFEGYCLLSFGEKSIIIDTESGSCFMWEIPNGFVITFGISFNDKTYFILERRDQNCFFVGKLGDGEDVLISDYNTVLYEIESEIETGRFEICSIAEKAEIKNVHLGLTSNGKTEIRINANKNLFADFVLDKAEFDRSEEDLIKFFCGLNGAKWFGISIKTKNKISLGDIRILYSKLI